MAIKPILFNKDMVRAILDRSKTVTRRVVKFTEGRNPNWTGYKKDGLILYNGKNEPCNKKPPYQPGDILYVRETVWQLQGTKTDMMTGETVFFDIDNFRYCATDAEPANHYWRKRPSIHMPKKAARIWLKCTSVRVERLQEMKTEDFLSEGILGAEYDIETKNRFVKVWNSTLKKPDLDRYGWDANPWVWVIEFERCEKPEEPLT